MAQNSTASSLLPMQRFSLVGHEQSLATFVYCVTSDLGIVQPTRMYCTSAQLPGITQREWYIDEAISDW